MVMKICKSLFIFIFSEMQFACLKAYLAHPKIMLVIVKSPVSDGLLCENQTLVSV